MARGICLFNLHFLDYESKIARHMLPVALGLEAEYIFGADYFWFCEPRVSTGGVI